MTEHRVWHFNDVSKPADAVYIGRAMPRYGLDASPWRNIFRIVEFWNGRNSKREQRRLAIVEFSVLAGERDPHWLDPLIGHDLACWCARKGHPLTADDPLICHGQVLLRLLRERNGGTA